VSEDKEKVKIFVNQDQHEINTRENVSGTLAPGHEVVVKDGMRFRVSGTGES